MEPFECSVPLPAKPEDLARKNLCFGRGGSFARGEKRVTRLDDELEGIQRLDQVLRPRMAEQDVGEFRIVARPELQGGLVEALRSRIGRQRERAIAGFAEAEARPTGQPFGLGACCPIELERRQVMVSEHLGVVLRAPERLDPSAAA